jgi:ATP-dependent Clp protease protease subunit
VKSVNIHIDGAIGGEDGFTLSKLNKQLKAMGNIDELNVFINSGGGYTTEGYAIYDKLMSLPFVVNTIANGMVASIATVIFQAGRNKGKRKLYKNSEPFIHNPNWQPSPFEVYEAKDVEGLHQALLHEETKLMNFYAEITGKTGEEIKPVMDRAASISPQEFIDLGLADEIVQEQIQAYTKYAIAAYYSNHNKNSEMSTELKAELTGFKKILAQITKRLFKNAKAETAEGLTVYYEGDMLSQGTVVYLDEAMTELATGVHTINDLKVTLDENGVVLTLEEVEVVEDALTQANAKIAELQAALDAANTVVAEKETVIEETKTNIEVLAKKVNEFETKLVTGANFKAQGSQHEKTDVPNVPQTNGEKLLAYRAAQAQKK